MTRYQFRKIFGWMAWLMLIIAGGWAGLFVLDFLDLGTRNVGILAILLALGVMTFAVDSMMENNPESIKKYFINWLVACGLFLFFALSIWTWYPTG